MSPAAARFKDLTLTQFLRADRAKTQQSLPMPSVLAQSIAKRRKSTNPSSQQLSSLPALSHRALSAASTLNFVTELRRSRRARRPSAHKVESDEYEASSQGSSRPPSPSRRKQDSQSEQDPRGERGNRPGRIVQPDRGTRATSYIGSPEPSTAPGPQRGNPVLARPASPGDPTEAICRATAFLVSDASKLSARTLKQVLDAISDNAEETQESPVEPEGGSAPTVLQSTRGMVLGGGHQPPATGTTDNINSPQRPSTQPASAKGKHPLDGRPREWPPNEDMATESESEPESIELGPGDSVSQRLPPAPTPLCATTIPSRPPLPPISHPLHGAGEAERSNDARMKVDLTAIDELSASDSDAGSQAAHARKRPRLGVSPQPIHLSPPRLSRAMTSSTTDHPPHRIAPHATQTTAHIPGPASVASPPSTSDLSTAIHWAAQRASESTRPRTTNTQGAGPSGQAGRISEPEVAFDLVTKVLEALRSNLATTTPAPTLQSNPRKRRPQPKHTDPVEDDAEMLEAEAALELGQHVRSRRKPTLADFPGLPRRITSLAIPELVAVACTQGAYEVFGTLCDWAGDTYNEVWGRELGHLRLQKAPHPLKSIMVHRISWFRGETKNRVAPAVPFAFPFINPPRTREDLIHNCELANKLLPNVFHCLDPDKPNERQYEHPAIRDCIATAFFWAPDSLGMIYHDKFQPVPLPAVAMVLTVMQHCIKEWKTGRRVPCQLNAGKQLKVYNSHLKGLLQYTKWAARRLNKFQRAWFKYGVAYAGTLHEDEEPYQPITDADHVRPDTPISDAGAEFE